MSRVGTNLTLQIQSRAPLLLTSPSTPDEAGGLRSQLKVRCTQVTDRKLSSLLDAESTFALILHAAISRILRAHLMRGCVRTTLVSAHTHEHIYACMTIWEWGGCSGCAVRRERSQGGGGWLEGAQSG